MKTQASLTWQRQRTFAVQKILIKPRRPMSRAFKPGHQLDALLRHNRA